MVISELLISVNENCYFKNSNFLKIFPRVEMDFALDSKAKKDSVELKKKIIRMFSIKSLPV